MAVVWVHHRRGVGQVFLLDALTVLLNSVLVPDIIGLHLSSLLFPIASVPRLLLSGNALLVQLAVFLSLGDRLGFITVVPLPSTLGSLGGVSRIMVVFHRFLGGKRMY
ncbi:hypothetical protein H257_15200 [Aphanomyces astaci]|uniref:Uncharacterized protein n=1 Tax=Aphanomyces astaci TaxID=112090 RepID=W4FNN7_APHAT|nr:hypothetical protein H257_15200 [Aphanomyces astaci]ETV69060.1 hypothetical protein H257_15200 [Aphanomyces astaci]|eukprot:XP_009841519.1 hypothetical protein H257_15200 [Aphanomyces astaci]